MTNYKITGYAPEKLFQFFEDICAIPHGSKNEKALSDFLVSFAKERNLWVHQDEALNVIIKKPASKGAENAPAVMLQGHIDMVCEKLASVNHDFEKDGLDLIVENGILRANGTTLGADNGVAVALMMTVLDDNSLTHPALECVFTTEEEIGLNGAAALDKSLINAKTMINMDSEAEGYGTVSCAGGMRYTLTKSKNTTKVNGTQLKLSIRGLLGGHSGIDIDKERTNALKLMARFVCPLMKNGKLYLFNGGTKDNAIPRECDASVIFENMDDAVAAQAETLALAEKIALELKSIEPDFSFTCDLDDTSKEYDILTDGDKLAYAVRLAPNGVRVRNPKQGNFVVTSLNLGIVNTNDDMRLVFAPRSSVDSLQDDTMELLSTLAESFGFQTEVAGRYPGWAFAENSRIRDVFCERYKALYNKEMQIEALHAGLECGLFSSAIDGLDAIAVGPTIYDCHTPDEHLPLDSFSRFYQLLCDVLAHLV